MTTVSSFMSALPTLRVARSRCPGLRWCSWLPPRLVSVRASHAAIPVAPVGLPGHSPGSRSSERRVARGAEGELACPDQRADQVPARCEGAAPTSLWSVQGEEDGHDAAQGDVGMTVDPELDRSVPPSGTSCVECLAGGGWWLHLRRCVRCGHIGCCDSSPSTHASKHAHSAGHPLVQSFEPSVSPAGSGSRGSGSTRLGATAPLSRREHR